VSVILSVEDMRKKAKARVPRMFFDYAESGSWTEDTLRANINDLMGIKFRQRVAVDISERSTEMEMLGEKLPMPVALAPTGLAGMQTADGEIHAARAAEKFGVPFTLSTMSVCSIEEVQSKTRDPFWFQLYVMRDRDFIDRLIKRAKEANCSALMITLDLQVMGQRHRDIKNGLSVPPKINLPNILNLITKPKWCLGMLGTKNRKFGNIVGHVKGVKDMSSLAEWTVNQFDPTLCWDDVLELRKKWSGKIVLKGIMDKEDAKAALNIGADAIIVSNHGGRQLDGASSSVSALPKILDIVQDKCEIWVDGGIRTGQDILRLIALGAKGTLIGRAFLYGLGAEGEKGVTRILEILQKELDLTMALCGATDLSQVNKNILL
jgi:L-lactate dehydrogenase (cytochrome)|tara:strand:- start:28 stop:1161 length:1134 start_codon:yes stop_codon:yes gene_type:complete